MSDLPKDVKTRIETEFESINPMVSMFDRYLLYNIAVQILPPDVIASTIDLWYKHVQKSIDIDASNRTHFLESTPHGRLAKVQNQPDGEELRLRLNDILTLAKTVVHHNLNRPEQTDETL